MMRCCSEAPDFFQCSGFKCSIAKEEGEEDDEEEEDCFSVLYNCSQLQYDRDHVLYPAAAGNTVIDGDELIWADDDDVDLIRYDPMQNRPQDAFLDPELWSTLPEALIEKVLLCLPLHTLFKLKCVCRKWNANLSGSSFRREYNRRTEGQQRQYYMLIIDQRNMCINGVGGDSSSSSNRSRECLLYSKGMSRWLSLNPRTSSLAMAEGSDIVATSGGLLCVRDRLTGTLSVHNPTNLHDGRILPPLIKARGLLPEPVGGAGKWALEVGMWVHPNEKDFQLVVWTDGPSPFTQLYFSSTNQWSLSGSVVVDIRGDPLWRCGVVSGPTFYMPVLNEYLSVFAYSVVRDRWTELRAVMPANILYSYLIDGGSSRHVMMVGAIGEDFPMQGICVWRLKDDESGWVEVLRMPDSLYLKLTRGFRAFDAFKCAGQGDQLCFLVDGRVRALMYDFSCRLWWWSPRITTGFRGHYQIISAHLRFQTQS